VRHATGSGQADEDPDLPITSYNERLFSGGIRSAYHLARFNWVAGEFRAIGLRDVTLVEVGCFDGRLLDELGGAVCEYVGLDANEDEGLDRARGKYRGRSDVTLIEATDPSPLRAYGDGHFTAAAALETLEHMTGDLAEAYLDELARITNGHLFVSLPNELGPAFLAKYAAKKLLFNEVEPYSWKELLAAAAWRSDLVERGHHKGFDYRALVRAIGRRFDIRSVEGLPKTGLPASLSPTVAILAQTRRGPRGAGVAA